MKQLIGFIALSFTLSACATMPGGISVSKSDYDGEQSVKLTPGYAGNLWIGFRKSQSMKPKEIYMIVRSDGIEHFSTNQPNLSIKIDDSPEIRLTSLDKTTECEISSKSDVAHCFQEYAVDQAFLEKIASSKVAKCKLSLRTSFQTCDMNQKGPTTMRGSLDGYIAKLKELKLWNE